MRGKGLEGAMLMARRAGRAEVVFFVNGGDPDPEVSFELLRTLARHGSTAVELCVPFPNSLTDGPVIRASHRRALDAGTTFETVLRLASRASAELGLRVVLLADHSHTVLPVGMDRFLRAALDSGVSATLVHALPQSERSRYVESSATLGLGRIMTFFISSDERTRRGVYADANGYVYVVSRFGRTGQAASPGPDLVARVAALSAETTQPLAIGFGVRSARDVCVLRGAGAAAAVIGSAAISVVARHLREPERIIDAFDAFVSPILSAGRADRAGDRQGVTD